MFRTKLDEADVAQCDASR